MARFKDLGPQDWEASRNYRRGEERNGRYRSQRASRPSYDASDLEPEGRFDWDEEEERPRTARRPRSYREQRGRSGLRVFDRTLQITHIWLNEIVDELGPDKHHAWKVLSIVLHKLRDRLPIGVAAHLGAQLPLLVRGVYYDQFTPARQPTDCDLEEFLSEVAEWLSDARPTDPRDAVQAVFRTLSLHVADGTIAHVQDALPKDLRTFWWNAEEAGAPPRRPRGSRHFQA